MRMRNSDGSPVTGASKLDALIGVGQYMSSAKVREIYDGKPEEFNEWARATMQSGHDNEHLAIGTLQCMMPGFIPVANGRNLWQRFSWGRATPDYFFDAPDNQTVFFVELKRPNDLKNEPLRLDYMVQMWAQAAATGLRRGLLFITSPMNGYALYQFVITEAQLNEVLLMIEPRVKAFFDRFINHVPEPPARGKKELAERLTAALAPRFRLVVRADTAFLPDPPDFPLLPVVPLREWLERK
jgi:hypothetical protein